MIRIGTRSSGLAVAQAELVAKSIQEKLGLDSEIIKISSLGDKDQISRLTSFRGQGIFTSSLERALKAGEIDVAVHSLKDLPVEVREDLPLVAYYSRHSPGDSLLIREECVISQNPLQLKKNTSIATGSPRRQSQILDQFPDVHIVDIRGNVHTRLSRVTSIFVDGLIMASAVFDRIDLPLPEDVVKIDLDPELFPPAPGQASIAVQTRAGELQELVILNDKVTQTAVEAERNILQAIGGGCELSLGAYIALEGDTWTIHASFADELWHAGTPSTLSRFRYSSTDIQVVVEEFMKFKLSSVKPAATDKLRNIHVALARDQRDAYQYEQLLNLQGAIVTTNPILEYETQWQQLEDAALKSAWQSCEWVVISSQRAVPFLKALYQSDPQSKRYAVVGSKTAARLRSYDFPVHLIAAGSMYSLDDKMQNALEIYPGEVLYLHGRNYTAQPGWITHTAPVYHANILPYQLHRSPDYLVVYSTRSAKAIIEQNNGLDTIWVALGESTASFLESKGYTTLQAALPTPEGILQVILEHQQGTQLILEDTHQ